MNGISIPKFFVIVCLLAGMVLINITPPLAAPDENAHFLNSYALAYGLPIKEEGGKIGRMYPSHVVEFVVSRESLYAESIENKYSSAQAYFDSWLPISGEDEAVFYPTAAASANPISYIPQFLGILLGRIVLSFFHMDNPSNLIFFGRLFNLLFYTGIMYVALKHTPIYQVTMAFLALTPKCLHIASSLSYDTLIITAAFLLFSYVFNIISSKRNVILRDYIAIICIAVVLICVKQVYAFLLAILLFIPKKRFVTTRKYVLSILSVVSISLIVYVIHQLYIYQFNLTSPDFLDEQLAYVLSNWWRLPSIFINSIREYAFFLLSSFASGFGQLDAHVYYPVVCLYFLMLTFFIAIDSVKCSLVIPIYQIFISFISGLAALFFSYFAMYLLWTPYFYGVGSALTTGVQGRYFLPIIPYIILLFSRILPKSLRTKLSAWSQIHQCKFTIMEQYIFYFSAAFCSICTILSIFTRYKSI